MPFTFTVAMIDGEDPGAGRQRRSVAQLERDAALDRVGRTRRWMVIAAAALTAAFAALVSAIAPGRSFGVHAQARGHARALNAARTGAATSLRLPPLASAGDLGLQAASQAPQSAPAPAQAQASAPPAQAPVAQAPAASQASPSSGAPAVVSGGS